MWEHFAAAPPSGLGKLFGGGGRFERELDSARAAYARAVEQHTAAEAGRRRQLTGQRAACNGSARAPAASASPSTVSSGPGTSAASATTPPTTGSPTCVTPIRARPPAWPSSARSATAHTILDAFTDDELQVIARFITAMADSMRRHVRELEGRLPGMRPAVAGMVVASAGSNVLAKGLVRRPRPAGEVAAARRPGRTPVTSSFPSGHAAAAAAFATGVGLEMPALAVPVGALAAAVGVSRVVNGVHYPSDIAGGWVFGVGVGMLTLRWWPLRRSERAAAARPCPEAPTAPCGGRELGY